MPVPITTGPVHIPLSDEERISGILTPLHLYDAVDALRSDGVVILDNAGESGIRQGSQLAFIFS